MNGLRLYLQIASELDWYRTKPRQWAEQGTRSPTCCRLSPANITLLFLRTSSNNASSRRAIHYLSMLTSTLSLFVPLVFCLTLWRRVLGPHSDEQQHPFFLVIAMENSWKVIVFVVVNSRFLETFFNHSQNQVFKGSKL